MIRETIARLADGKAITGQEAYETMQEIMGGEATPAQIASYITALRMAGESPEVIAGSAKAMHEKFTPVSAPVPNAVDTCGTGGDGANTFNISTASAFVAAGAGIVVAKHGNKSVSSKSGSADVLEALGVNIGIDAAKMEACLKSVGIAFLFAPALHPAMKHAIGPRKELGIRTIFNILGPLSNPAGVRRGVLGVYSHHLVETLGAAAAELGAEHLFIVHGKDGLDEITTTTTTHIAEIKDGKVTIRDLHPEEVGIPLGNPDDLAGGSPDDNAAIIRRIFEGEEGPRRDIVVINAAAAILAGEGAPDLPSAVVKARESIETGAALAKLNALAETTQG